MSIQSFIICLDCKEYADLSSFYVDSYLRPGSPPWSQKANDFMKAKELAEILNDWGAWTGRAIGFLFRHNGHRVGIYTENEIEGIEDPIIDHDDPNLPSINGFEEKLSFKQNCLEPFVKKKK